MLDRLGRPLVVIALPEHKSLLSAGNDIEKHMSVLDREHLVVGHVQHEHLRVIELRCGSQEHRSNRRKSGAQTFWLALAVINGIDADDGQAGAIRVGPREPNKSRAVLAVCSTVPERQHASRITRVVQPSRNAATLNPLLTRPPRLRPCTPGLER